MAKLPTSERLAQVLHAEGLLDMEAKARTGYYDDYRSELPTPIAQLVRDLYAHQREDLAKRAMNGEWDGTREEAEAWMRSQGRSQI